MRRSYCRRRCCIPIESFGKPEEIAEAILFPATTDAQFIQGHNLVIDGGYIIH